MGPYKRRLTRVGLMFVLIFFAAPVFAVEAHMYRCKDKNGRVYYSDRPGMECQGGETDEMTKQGLVMERPDALRPGESPEERQARLAQQRQDRALMQTYSSEQQIEAAKKRSLETPLLAVKYAKKKLAIYTDRLSELRNREVKYSIDGKEAPLSLIEEIDETLSDIARLEYELESKQRSVERVIDRFEADKERYRELLEAHNRGR
ncbi:MAG TPA: DUF4124 domain-containing protein [Burkholderiales bacterium]|nr:DUF4124 domain-containing protein [Burkholderiales bacterium]